MLQWLVKRFDVDLVFEGREIEVSKSFMPLEALRSVEVIPPWRSWLRMLKAVLGRMPYHHTLNCHPGMEKAVCRMLQERNYSLIWLNKSIYHPLIARDCNAPFVVDQHAAEPIVWDNLIQNDPKFYAKPFFKWNKSKVLRYDKTVYRKAAGIICISKLDYNTTDRFYPGSHLIYIPQGVDPNYYMPNPAVNPDIDLVLFSGTGVTRNLQAAKIFINQIMPLVHKRNRQMKFLWIGNVNRREHPLLGKPWVTTTGFVQHTPPYFDHGMIYVAPFDMGEGMKTKVIEAMAMGKVIVSTPIGVQGIEVEGLPFVKVCSDPGSFAEAILDFRENFNLPQLGEQARKHALDHYTWEAVLRPLEPFLNRCMQSRERSS